MNIIVIICDTLRRDFLGYYGNGRMRTPHIDRLASESLIFDRAFIGSFPTIPLRAELMTGQHVFHTTGWAPLAPGQTTLQSYLQGQGYVTAMITDNVQYLNPGMNYHVGFDACQWIRGHQADRWRTSHTPVVFPCNPAKLRQPDFLVVPHLRNNRNRTHEREWHDPQTIQAAMDWLEENYRQERFLLYLDLFGIHEPWDPPQAYVDLYDPGYQGEKVILPRYDRVGYMSDAELRHCRALYAGMITMTDLWLGRLFAKLETLDLWDDTAILFMSDHGFYLGEHGYVGKHTVLDHKDGWPLYTTVAHVPVLLKLADAASPAGMGMNDRGRRVTDLVQPVDLMPTLLELGGVTPPDGLHGNSLLPALRAEGGSRRELAVSSPRLATDPDYRVYSTVTDGEWTLIDGGSRESWELYHLTSDPSQAANVVAEQPQIAERLHRAYIGYLEDIGTADEKLALRTVA